MRDSDWSRQILLRSDWLGPSVALITTVGENLKLLLSLGQPRVSDTPSGFNEMLVRLRTRHRNNG